MEDEQARLTAELMHRPLAEFTAARAAMVKELRVDGKRDLAQALSALRKPSLPIWAINQAGVVAATDLDALRDAGDRLRDAQRRVLEGDRGAARDLQEATQVQRRQIDALTRRLGMVLTAAGHAASDETLRRVSDMLRAASIADADTWDAVRTGWLTAEPEAASLPDLDARAAKRASEERAIHEDQTHRRRIEAAEQDVRRAEEQEQAAREQLDAARTRLDEASRTLEAARAALSALRSPR